ncbi:hypothetical protein EVAR_30811_1 [Eumeta japonica]|uniref:Uncharacterized protein n=1 Tax=Eumeta variegata TaxID=151549 RepID=A0A4C1V7F9_EUMVA|nr:hypothetical protein EVAR_30811_1 [Eumeta japonica]
MAGPRLGLTARSIDVKVTSTRIHYKDTPPIGKGRSTSAGLLFSSTSTPRTVTGQARDRRRVAGFTRKRFSHRMLSRGTSKRKKSPAISIDNSITAQTLDSLSTQIDFGRRSAAGAGARALSPIAETSRGKQLADSGAPPRRFARH